MRVSSCARAGTLVACLFGCQGCYAGLGPTLGFAGGSPTVGWEASGATATVGQSFATDSERQLASRAPPGKTSFVRRTYLLWEPRLGGTNRATSASLGDELLGDNTTHAFDFAGVGVSAGMRWDRVAGRRESEFGALGGMFVGGGHALAGGASGCSPDNRLYLSVALGFRGSELYFAPKVGWLQVPRFCITLSGLNWQ